MYNSEGLFLRGEKGITYTTVKNEQNEDIAKILPTDVDRVEISWKGLILRNWDNEDVFFANPDTGNLTLRKITAESGKIGGWEINEHSLTSVPMTDNGKTFAGI